MAVSLAEAKKNTTDDVDVAVIDEFRKESALLDAMIFDDVVNPAGGGATLTYGYRRQATQATAAFRELNTEYTPQNVTTSQHSVNLAVLGGSFEVDRVIAKLGPAASSAVSLNIAQKVKAAKAAFTDAVINGDVDVDANGFDGLDKALRGSSTEYNTTTAADWSDLDTVSATSHKILDALDEWLGLLDGTPTLIVGNDKSLARVRAAARRANMYVKSPVDGLTGPDGRPIVRESYGDLTFVDAGAKAGSNDRIIPVRTVDLDNTSYTSEITGTPTGGTFKYNVTIDGVTQETGTIAYNAANADYKAALEALSSVPANSVTVTGTTTKTIVFAGALSRVVVTLALGTNGLTGGTTPSVTVTETATTTNTGSMTDLFAFRIGLDGFHGVSTIGGQLAQTWLPDFASAGAVKKGEVELGPVAVALKATKAAAVFRNIKVA